MLALPLGPPRGAALSCQEADARAFAHGHMYAGFFQSNARDLVALTFAHMRLTGHQPWCRHLRAAGSPGLVVDPGRIVWSPYAIERDLANFRH